MRYIPDDEDNEEHEENSDGEGDHEYDNEGTVMTRRLKMLVPA